MKNLIFIIAGILAMIAIYAHNNPRVDFKKNSEVGIQFHQANFGTALELAANENKLIFLDVYASWCGPCKRLKANTFSNAEVGSFFNKNFINVALDAEAGEGIQIAEKYKVEEYPTLLFINSKGMVVYEVAGFKNAKELIDLGKKINKK